MKATVVIPTYNRSEKIISLIQSILSEELFLQEIIVVDDGSKTNHAQKVKNYCESISNVDYYYQENLGFRAGRARNIGIINAKGDIIIFLDDDIVITDHFIQNHINSHFGKSKHFVVGFRDNRSSFNELDYSNISYKDYRFEYLKRNPSLMLDCPWYFAYTCNLSVTNDPKLKLFDEEFVGWGNEDIDFVLNNYKEGFSIDFDFELVVIQQIDDDLKDPFKILETNNEADFTSYIKNKIRLLSKNLKNEILNKIVYDELMYFYLDNNKWKKSDTKKSNPEDVINYFVNV